MLKPNHVCAWSHSRRTVLKYQGSRFETEGTSLPVLLDAFRQEAETEVSSRLRWYSLAHGEVHGGEHENLTLIAADADAPGLPAPEIHPEVGPLNRALLRSGGDGVAEYVLSPDVRAALRIGDEASDFSPQEGSRVRHAVFLHDDCFGSVEPVDEGLLARLVHAALKLHSFYLGREIGWEPVLPELTRLLLREEAFELVSKPRADVVYVEVPPRSTRSPFHPFGAYVRPRGLRIRVGTGTAEMDTGGG